MEKKVTAVIDRIEDNGLAVLEIEGEAEFLWPVQFLPVGAREGNVLDFLIRINPEEEARRRREIEEIQRELLERTARMDEEKRKGGEQA